MNNENFHYCAFCAYYKKQYCKYKEEQTNLEQPGCYLWKKRINKTTRLFKEKNQLS